MAMSGVDFGPVQADSQLKSSGLVLAPFYIHQMNYLCYDDDDSTTNIILELLLINYY